MDKLLDLAISYPDFQLNQIIDPEQTDLNNAQIVTKINQLVASINAMTQGETGAGNITIKPLPEFPSATNVQQALNQIATYCKENNTTIQSILAKNTEQDGRLATLETTASNHGSRIGTLESDNASNKERLATAESINTSQAQHLTTVDSRLANIETKNTQQDTSITSINNKNDTQDRTLVSHEVVMDSHARRLSSVESVNTKQSNDITKIKGDIANINASNTNVEVVSARRTANGEQFDTIGKRMDYNEIGVGTSLTTGQRGKMNMLLTSSNDTEFWEDSASLGSISDHNASPDAHSTLLANHELDTTSHQDIRDAIANIDVVTGWEDVQNKPSTFPPSTHTHDGSHITGSINADTVDGLHATNFVKVNDTTVGKITATGTIATTDAQGFRVAYGGQGFFIRNDSNNVYFMLTNKGDEWGGYNALRPMSIATSTGNVTFEQNVTVKRIGINEYLGCVGNADFNGNVGITGQLYINTSEGTISVNSELDSLKSSVSSGKTAVANAITAKGVATSNTAEFATMASNINAIKTLNTSSWGQTNASGGYSINFSAGRELIKGTGNSTPYSINKAFFIITPYNNDISIVNNYTITSTEDFMYRHASSPASPGTFTKTKSLTITNGTAYFISNPTNSNLSISTGYTVGSSNFAFTVYHIL